MKTYQKFIPVLGLALILGACSTTTELRKTWSDPSLSQGPVEPFNKVIIMVTAKTEENRIAAEDKLVTLIKHGTAVPSYKYVTPADTSTKELVEKLIKDGFDGAITLRVKAAVRTKTVSDPGTTYSSFVSYGPYGYSYGVSYELGSGQGNTHVDMKGYKDYIIETNIYSLKKKMLLWSGVTASLSPSKVEPTMTGIVNTIRQELEKKGFLKKD
ncbi:MAG: hypothetical protein U5L72_01095 [Bacteroidales bacterium]|nr:hypothetical protein [Bacteroidales bacterium]